MIRIVYTEFIEDIHEPLPEQTQIMGIPNGRNIKMIAVGTDDIFELNLKIMPVQEYDWENEGFRIMPIIESPIDQIIC